MVMALTCVRVTSGCANAATHAVVIDTPERVYVVKVCAEHFEWAEHEGNERGSLIQSGDAFKVIGELVRELLIS